MLAIAYSNADDSKSLSFENVGCTCGLGDAWSCKAIRLRKLRKIIGLCAVIRF